MSNQIDPLMLALFGSLYTPSDMTSEQIVTTYVQGGGTLLNDSGLQDAINQPIQDTGGVVGTWSDIFKDPLGSIKKVLSGAVSPNIQVAKVGVTTPSWLWIAIVGVAGLVLFLLFRKKR